MFAIVEISGQQFKVAKDDTLFVNRLDRKKGDLISLDKVLLTADNKKVSVGTPVLQNTTVQIEVLRHLKDDKVIVFKKKRRKGYKVKNGHRQHLTEIKVKSIGSQKNTKKTTTAKVLKPDDSKSDKINIDLTSKSLSEIKSIAKTAGLTGFSSMKKAEIIKLIETKNNQ